MWNKLVEKKVKPISSGINVSLDELIVIRNKVICDPISIKKESRELSSGDNHAKTRGRGIEFDTTREYQPGDDIRRMAWRVTARNLQPHIKVYHEERERPVWLALDLSPSLYFGTRMMFKSVRMIKHTAFLGWSYLHKRERIGTFIAMPDKMLVYRPQPREREFLTILKTLAECSTIQPAFTETNCLQQLLITINQQVRSGNLIYILSDFLHFDEQNKKLLLHIAQRAYVKLVFVYDPLEAEPPPAHEYLVTDGEKVALFNMDKLQNRDHYKQQFQNKFNELLHFTRKHNMTLQILCTNQEEVLSETWMRSYNN